MTPKDRKLLRWFLEDYQTQGDGSFVKPPRLIRVFEDETCTFFTSKKAKDYALEMNILFLEGASGDLQRIRIEMETLAKIQSSKQKKNGTNQPVKRGPSEIQEPGADQPSGSK